MISAVLDACVLYPASLRDFLLNLATEKVFLPRWSEEIRNEWISNLLENRPDLKPENLERTRRRMDVRLPNSLVRGYEAITLTLQLPDPKDQHVLAAAIHAKAKYIVTFNLAHFPNSILQSYNIEVISPDKFIQCLIKTVPNSVIRLAGNHRLSLTRPPLTVEEYLATLEQQGLQKTVTFLREHKNNI